MPAQMNVLKRMNARKLEDWLLANHETLVAEKLNYAEIASRAERVLEFTCTAWNVQGAMSVMGLRTAQGITRASSEELVASMKTRLDEMQSTIDLHEQQIETLATCIRWLSRQTGKALPVEIGTKLPTPRSQIVQQGANGTH